VPASRHRRGCNDLRTVALEKTGQHDMLADDNSLLAPYPSSPPACGSLLGGKIFPVSPFRGDLKANTRLLQTSQKTPFRRSWPHLRAASALSAPVGGIIHSRDSAGRRRSRVGAVHSPIVEVRLVARRSCDSAGGVLAVVVAFAVCCAGRGIGEWNVPGAYCSRAGYFAGS